MLGKLATLLDSVLDLGILARIQVARDDSLQVLTSLSAVLDGQFVLGLVERRRMVVYVHNFDAKRASIGQRMWFAFVFGFHRYAVLVEFVGRFTVEHHVCCDQTRDWIDFERHVAFVRVCGQDFILDFAIFAFVSVARFHLNHTCANRLLLFHLSRS